MFGGVIVEREQLVEIIGEFGDGLGELRAVGGLEGLDRGAGVVLVLGAPDLRQGLLRPRVRGFGSAASTFAVLWNQQRCSRVCGKTSRSPPQNPSSTAVRSNASPARPASRVFTSGPSSLGLNPQKFPGGNRPSAYAD